MVRLFRNMRVKRLILWEGNCVSSLSLHDGFDSIHILSIVWIRRVGKGSFLCDFWEVVVENVVELHCEPVLVAVQISDDWAASVCEDVGLHKDLSPHPAVDPRRLTILVYIVVDVGSAETEGWKAGVTVVEPVVVIGDTELREFQK